MAMILKVVKHDLTKQFFDFWIVWGLKFYFNVAIGIIVGYYLLRLLMLFGIRPPTIIGF